MIWLDRIIDYWKHVSWIARRLEAMRLKRARRELEISVSRMMTAATQANNVLVRRYIPAMIAMNEAMTQVLDGLGPKEDDDGAQ